MSWNKKICLVFREYFTANNIKKTGLNWYAYKFSVDCNIIDSSNITKIHKYLMKNTIQSNFYCIIFIVLLASIANAFDHTKSASLSNQKSKIQPALINLHPNEYNQELNYY